MNLKVFSPQFPAQIPLRLARLGQASLLAFLLTVGAKGWCEAARPIDWDTLNLTPQQQTQMQHLETSWQKTHQEVNGQIEKDTAEMKEMLPNGDSQRIRQLQNRISTNKMYLMNESMDTFLRKREMLTPPQRAQLMKMMPTK